MIDWLRHQKARVMFTQEWQNDAWRLLNSHARLKYELSINLLLIAVLLWWWWK